MDLGTVEYFGTANTPEVTIGHLVRVAIALPLFIESVEVSGHLYVDGGVIEVWPVQPVIDEGGFDHVFGVNFMLPKGFRPKDISGWPQRTGGLFEASRQMQQGFHLETARRAKAKLGERLTVIDPVDDSELQGTSFYDLFLDRSHWPRLIRQGYEAADGGARRVPLGGLRLRGGRPDRGPAHPPSRKNSPIARWVCSGASICGTCPQLSSRWRAAGSARSTCLRNPIGTSWSWRPQTNRQRGCMAASRDHSPCSPWGSSR